MTKLAGTYCLLALNREVLTLNGVDGLELLLVLALSVRINNTQGPYFSTGKGLDKGSSVSLFV
jgi:hypothetical protein